MKKKNPTTAAVLNFIIPGLGYIYARKREQFGWLVLLSMVLYVLYSYDKPELLGEWMLTMSFLVLSFAFAFDIYRELKPKK